MPHCEFTYLRNIIDTEQTEQIKLKNLVIFESIGMRLTL